MSLVTVLAPARRAARRTSGTRRSSVCSSCSRRSACSAARSTCCSARTSVRGSASSSPARASPASWCCSRACGSRPRRRSTARRAAPRVGRSWRSSTSPADVRGRGHATIVENGDPVDSRRARAAAAGDRRRARDRRGRKAPRNRPSSRSRSSAAAPTSSPTSRATRPSRSAAAPGTCSGTTRGTRSSRSATRSRRPPVAGQPPPTPTCDPLTPEAVRVMQYDFGSLRQPPWSTSSRRSCLFGLFLLGLHWYEQDARERKNSATADLRPVPTS